MWSDVVQSVFTDVSVESAAFTATYRDDNGVRRQEIHFPNRDGLPWPLFRDLFTLNFIGYFIYIYKQSTDPPTSLAGYVYVLKQIGVL